MKKLFTFFVAALAAVTLSATEQTMDMNAAQPYVEFGSSTPSVMDGALNVSWSVSENWSVAGAAFALGELEEVSKISFEYKGDGSAVSMLVWLENAETGKFWDSQAGGQSLEQAEWTSVELTPDAPLWSETCVGPWTQLVFAANPASASEGVFYLRNIKIEYTESYRKNISIDPSNWTWGYDSSVGAVAGGLQTTITSDWGAVSTGWDPEIDMTKWDKIVIEVSNMDNCAGEWWKLKAYLRDKSDTEAKQMEGFLGLDAPDNQLNYLVIDLHQQVEGFDLTKARILAVQCQPTGGIFTISSVYLLKEEPSAVSTTVVTEKATKRIVNGQLLIERDGKLFNLTGAQVK